MPDKTQSVLLAGVAVGVVASFLALVPFAGGCLVCLADIAAGVVAVWHYTRTYRLTVPGGAGAGMGALAGATAGLIANAISFLLTAVGLRPDVRDVMLQGLEGSDLEPGQLDQIMNFVDSPAFLITVTVFVLVVAAILGAIGGAVGAALFKQDDNRSLGSSPDAF